MAQRSTAISIPEEIKLQRTINAESPELQSSPTLTAVPTTIPAGKIRNHESNWEKITSNPRVLATVKNGVKLPKKRQIEKFNMDRPPPSGELGEKLEEAVREYLQRKVISETTDPDQCTSPFFMLKQGEAKYRPILDLRHLNDHLITEHFKMEGLPTARQMLRKGDYLTKVDLKDAYQAVQLAPEAKKYMGFNWKGRTYQFNVMPFGLSTAPREFTKLMRTALTPLREKGMRLIFYLDDILLLANSKEEAQKNTEKLVRHLTNLGLDINKKKSVLEPSKRITFLGMELDSERMKILVPREKIKKTLQEATRALHLKKIKLRKLAAFSGLLSSLAFGFGPNQIHQRMIQRNIALFNQRRVPWDHPVPVFKETKRELHWWIRYLTRWNGKSIIEDEEECHIYTDASKSGWGASLSTDSNSGAWGQQERDQSSNFRELKAVMMSLRENIPRIKGKKVIVHSDNTTTIAQINRQSSPKHLHLLKLSKAIWNLCLRHQIKLKAEYIPGEENSAADSLSRINWDHEWELSDRLFQIIQRTMGPASVDLFASRRNRKLREYYSRFPESEALGTDALKAKTWPENAYANPPPILIHRVLEKIRKTGTSVILVTPHWPSQAWWAECLQLKDNKIKIKTTSQTAHLKGKRFNLPYRYLAVWKLSGKRGRNKALIKTSRS